MVIHVPAKFSCLRHCGPGDKMGLIFHANFPSGQREKTVVCLYGLKLLMVSHHSFKISSQRYCSSGNVSVLVCHVILQNHLIQSLCEFMGEKSSY